jgi:hypothetical protein
MGAGAARLQLATYPQSPFSGPAHCCDVTDLYQAFSQCTGPGRLWISLDAGLLAHFQQPRKPNQKDTELQFRPVQSKGSGHVDLKNRFADRIVSLLGRYPPYVPAAILGRHVISPVTTPTADPVTRAPDQWNWHRATCLGRCRVSQADLLPISGQVVSLAFGCPKGVFVLGYWLHSCHRKRSRSQVSKATVRSRGVIVGPPRIELYFSIFDRPEQLQVQALNSRLY